jgi:hypothetical protein
MFPTLIALAFTSYKAGSPANFFYALTDGHGKLGN